MTLRAQPPIRPRDDAAPNPMFDRYPSEAQAVMLDIRRLIFETALQTPGVGPLTETLKWGEPAYLTTASKSGSTLRLGWTPKAPDQVAIYLNCKTTLVDTFRNLVPDDLVYAGNRAILLAVSQPLPTEALTVCLRLALTYHGAKRTPPLSR